MRVKTEESSKLPQDGLDLHIEKSYSKMVPDMPTELPLQADFSNAYENLCHPIDA